MLFAFYLNRFLRNLQISFEFIWIKFFIYSCFYTIPIFCLLFVVSNDFSVKYLFYTEYVVIVFVLCHVPQMHSLLFHIGLGQLKERLYWGKILQLSAQTWAKTVILPGIQVKTLIYETLAVLRPRDISNHGMWMIKRSLPIFAYFNYLQYKNVISREACASFNTLGLSQCGRHFSHVFFQMNFRVCS